MLSRRLNVAAIDVDALMRQQAETKVLDLPAMVWS
jgi:hypothetical protein